MRPLSGQRELFRRLQENNEAHREQQNHVRQLSGLEPTETNQSQEYMDFSVNFWREYMSDYVGRPNTDSLRQELISSLADDTPIQLASRRGIGSSIIGLQQIMESTFIPESPLLNDHLVGFPQSQLTEMYSSIYSNPCNEITFGMENLEQYNRKLKIQDMKDKKDAKNQDFKFILEGDY